MDLNSQSSSIAEEIFRTFPFISQWFTNLNASSAEYTLKSLQSQIQDFPLQKSAPFPQKKRQQVTWSYPVRLFPLELQYFVVISYCAFPG